MSNLVSRTLTGAVFVVTIIGSIVLGQVVFAGLFFAVTLAALIEFYRLANQHQDVKISVAVAVFAGMVLYVSFAGVALSWWPSRWLLINLLLPLMLFINELYRKSSQPFVDVALALLGTGYIALPFALLTFFFDPGMAHNLHQPGLLMGFFFILWAHDSFAYLTGMLMGKHKLFPDISPKKTWEGSLGGLVFALVTAWIVSLFFEAFSGWDWLIMALLIVIFGTFGDLAESMFKRSLNIKDSGSLLPGHGGLLDRFDAVLMAAPAVFVYLTLIR